MRRSHLVAILVCAFSMLAAGSAWALPALQLGGGSGSWTYNVLTQPWEPPDNPLELPAFANATADDGGNGDYAWSVTGTTQIAYLVVSAVPKIATTEPPSLFDITVENDGGALPLYTSGNGAPPLSDPNDLAPHGIFSTYFEIYEFNFDGALTGIYNTVTGLDPAMGFQELFEVTINSLDSSVEQLHFDLFTIAGSGQLGATDQVFAFAPFSHDAQTVLPEPGLALLLTAGPAGLAIAGRKHA